MLSPQWQVEREEGNSEDGGMGPFDSQEPVRVLTGSLFNNQINSFLLFHLPPFTLVLSTKVGGQIKVPT